MSIEELASVLIDLEIDAELLEFAETENATFVAFASNYLAGDELKICKGCHGG